MVPKIEVTSGLHFTIGAPHDDVNDPISKRTRSKFDLRSPLVLDESSTTTSILSLAVVPLDLTQTQ
jgi:hypothetical protein